MKRQWLTIALAVGPIGWVGCGSSNSTQAPASMDQMATALEQQSAAKTPAQNENQTTGLKTKAAADNAAPTGPAAKAAPVAAADPALRTKRGFDLEDWSNEAAYVLVKTDAAKTADALAQIWKGKVVRDVFGKPTDEKRNQVVVYQLAGHPWSVFACDGRQLETLVPSLSRDADVLVAWNSDFNGWSGIALYRGGQEVEAIHWAPKPISWARTRTFPSGKPVCRCRTRSIPICTCSAAHFGK